MAEIKKPITRRDFLKKGSCLAAGSLIGLPLLDHDTAKASQKSRVVLIRDRDVFSWTGEPRYERLAAMVDQAMSTLFDTQDFTAPWKHLFSPSDVVGIKSNVWYHLPTPRALEAIIKERLQDAGVKRENMDTDDRGVLRNPLFQRSSALVNVRPMRSHNWSGLGSLIKNHIMFTPKPWNYHRNACERLGAVWLLPHVKGKTRLNILVMLTPQFHSVGPHHFSAKYTWKYNGLIVSTDPVAADATGARIIQAKRNIFFGKEKPISPRPLHIAAADTKFGLGNSRPENIELIPLGWDEEILI